VQSIGDNAPGSGVFTCIVDADPRFHDEALRWWATLHHVVGVSGSDIVVHAVRGTNSDALEYLRSRGVTVVAVDPFDVRAPHCNKISGALRLGALGPWPGTAVLTDTDVVILEDPRALPLDGDVVASRVVGGAHPPVEVLREVFSSAGVALPELVSLERFPEKQTVKGNSNGGVLLIPGDVLVEAGESWAKWARWLLDHRDLLGKGHIHVDQVAMAIALADGRLRPHPLELRWNFPAQNSRRIAADAPSPAIIHYHRNTDSRGLLKKTGVEAVDLQIDRANAAISSVWSDVHPASQARRTARRLGSRSRGSGSVRAL
jgi:hypothetical protein